MKYINTYINILKSTKFEWDSKRHIAYWVVEQGWWMFLLYYCLVISSSVLCEAFLSGVSLLRSNHLNKCVEEAC